MNTQIELSNPATIRAYFEKVRELQQTGEQYPINLDDIWALVYSEKHVAVRVLRNKFFETDDYLIFNQNVENSGRGRPEVDYRLTVSCMEYFIARKVRAVFEVYRTVFHHTIDTQPKVEAKPVQLSRKELAMMVIQIEEEKERLEKQLVIAKPKLDYVDSILNTSECLVTTQIANELGYSAAKLNQLLADMNIQWKVNGVWVLTSKYADRGYAQMRTHIKTKDNGETHTYMNLVWTQRGRAFIHYEFKKRGNDKALSLDVD